MKNLLIILTLLCTFISADAQGNWKHKQIAFGPDTISCAGAADTVIVYIGGTSFATARKFEDLASITVNVETDSLSGADVAGTLYVQFSNNGTHWSDIGSLTVNGPTNQKLRVKDTEFTDYAIRLYALSPSSTQSWRFWGDVGAKRKRE